MEIYEYIGVKIRQLRDQFRYSQDILAQKLNVSTNTVSRWETARYKPTVKDLQKIADLFKIKLSTLLPPEDSEDPSLKALLSATGDLPKEDIDELIKYAEFRRARRRLEKAKK
ncbi:MAG: helix-turn-helix domain-containing protein [Actinobacteria bacterium]|nr:helix-turn-helix domain-containing protein [Actinomycetota bacterium]